MPTKVEYTHNKAEQPFATCLREDLREGASERRESFTLAMHKHGFGLLSLLP
jgi:hypothetical protein